MDRIRITGGKSLTGEIVIGGAKNAALPLMAAALLSDKTLNLRNVPALDDIETMVRLLTDLGCTIEHDGERIALRAGALNGNTAPYDLVRRMRASVLVLGPLLARAGHARVSLPGGCAIGTRPIDLHLFALSRLGAEIELEDGYVVARAPNGLRGADIEFQSVSVGATENALMAACLADGRTRIDNAACEPEITDLARCLSAMGAKIEGIGSTRLTIEGTKSLGGADYAVIPDRIEAGSYAVAAAITHGEITLRNAPLAQMGATLKALAEMGVLFKETGDAGLRVDGASNGLRGAHVETAPYPGFATDMQAQVMALMTLAEGESVMTESIFENRFMHVPELTRMGADIRVNAGTAYIKGVDHLRGAPVMATDLRASMGLVLAGLAAEGETVVNRVYHLDRGYENLVGKLAGVGADIERLRE